MLTCSIEGGCSYVMFEKIVYENKQITAITVEWEAEFSEAMSVLKTFFDDNNTEHLLLDLRDSSFDNITTDHVRDLCMYAISRTNDNGGNKVNGKTALVGSKDLQSEIDRIFKTCSEMEDSDINVLVFCSKEKAFSWLEEG